MTVNDLSQPTHFQAAVHAMLEGLCAELGDAARFIAMDSGDRREQDRGWKVTPTRRSAASFEIWVYDHAVMARPRDEGLRNLTQVVGK